jgi:DNA-binding transcriptional LysR family regulator
MPGFGPREGGAMEMHQIRYFISVCETLNFTRAAERCNVTQPALTRAVHLLEQELGGELLRRERALTHLTELGRRMLPLMQQCYDTALSAKSLARSISTGETTTTLSLTIASSVSLALLTTPLAELLRLRPGVQLRLSRGAAPALIELLKRGEAELALLGSVGDAWGRLDFWPLFTEPFELIVSRDHTLVGSNAVEPEQLAGERLLVQPEGDMTGELLRWLSERGIPTADAHQVASDHDLIALLEANLGAAILPVSAAGNGRLCAVPLRGLDLSRTVAVCSVAGRHRSPLATMLLNMLRAADWSAYHDGDHLSRAGRRS